MAPYRLGNRTLTLKDKEIALDYSDRLGKLLIERFKWQYDTSSLHRFSNLIGIPSNLERDGMVVDCLNPKIRKIIDDLSGPYGEVLLKMYEIQNEQVSENQS